ncbi:hypothetical protein ACE10X_13185 [Bradyrhizobium sp. Pha-3]|uniref:hypothetical protein n=1 Tax=Bradyrhizobium sp. Pha-3 TaxID=208375 RepID=UPI0035D472A1
MADLDVAAPAADDDFDVTADLAAAFDAAENEWQAAPEPAAETAEQAAERVRDEKGRFAKVEEPSEQPAAKADIAATKVPEPGAKTVPAQPAAVDPLAQPVEATKPPPGFSPTAKVVWNKETLDKAEWDAVKRDIAKRNEEVDKGFAKFAEYKPVERFMEMAKQSGTTLDRALENYVGIEQELSRDMVSGVSRICQNKGIHPVALAQQILARHGASSQQDGTGEIQARQPAVDLTPITQELNALKSFVQQQQEAGVQSEIQRFASDPKHTFFENVKADMGRLINSGYADTLEDAYEKACWANPEIRDLLIKQQTTQVPDTGAKVAAATQARAAAKSITGSPIPNASAKGPNLSLEDEIRQLMDASV